MALVALKSGSAHAVPSAPPEGPCDSWHLKDSALVIDVGDPDRSQISIDWDANSGISPSTAATNARWSASGGTTTGNASGNGGPTSVDLTFNWTGNSGDRPAHFSGKIDPQFGSVNGSVTTTGGHRYDGNVNEHFDCVHHAAAPAAPAPANQPPAQAPAPAPAPVTNAIQLSFGPPHLGSITATISNSSALTAKCTYDSTPFNTHRDFTVNPNSSEDLTFNGFNTGTSYHVVVSCHDASGKQTQEIGHAETNVSF